MSCGCCCLGEGGQRVFLTKSCLSWAWEDWICKNENETFRAGQLGNAICEGEGWEVGMENEFRQTVGVSEGVGMAGETSCPVTRPSWCLQEISPEQGGERPGGASDWRGQTNV